MRFRYYQRLSRSDKAIYRHSDEYGAIAIEDPGPLRTIVSRLVRELAAEDRIAVERLSFRLVAGLCEQLGVSIAGTRVLAVRPRSAQSELHGLYVREEGARPVIMVWMRTAARRDVVAPRTFVRTLLHEACHHLDYELLELADSFHTEGFFQRESSLMRQIFAASAGRRS